VKVKIQDITTFKFIKALQLGDDSLPTLIVVFGYPFEIKNNFNYKGNFYYVDSHYNTAIKYPTTKMNISYLSEIITKELISKLKNKEVILVGYSLGALYSIEISKLLQKEGIKTKLLFLIDPLDSVYNINNKKYNILKYYTYNILLHFRYYLYFIITNIQNICNICILNHSSYINSIYRIHLLKYRFNEINENIILLKGKNNTQQTKYSINNIFNKTKTKIHVFDVNSHKDFFNDKNVLIKWLKILKNNI